MTTTTMLVGIERLVQDLHDQGYPQASVKQADFAYAIIPGFVILAGNFAGREIDLAIPATTDYPRSMPASMHIKADPHLVPFGGISNSNGSGLKRNVIFSNLGPDWQYWSYRFNNYLPNPTGELLAQINECFRTN